MGLILNEVVPDFEADTTQGKIRWHEWIGNSWAGLFSHPGDFTPICTTELGRMAQLQGEFDKRGVKIIALSVDDIESHRAWINDIEAYSGAKVQYPIIADEKREIATRYGMLPKAQEGQPEPKTCRAVFIINTKKQLKAVIYYPASTGRSFKEILRAIDSLQLTEKLPVATPAEWEPGQKVIVLVPPEEANKLGFRDVQEVELPSGKKYLRPAYPPQV